MFFTKFRAFFITLLLLAIPLCSGAKSVQYDIAYIWDDNIENVLDYQSRLEELFGPETAKHLRIVARKSGGYGIIYDHNGTALSSAKLMVQHSIALTDAGLPDCFAIEDHGYDELFNVSYGLGPNLDFLKMLYNKIYYYLGSEVGKDLYIEQTDNDNYTLIYRRRGDRKSTYTVARRHAKLLKKKKIYTTIIAERNNPVVYGESSLLDYVAPPKGLKSAKQTAKKPAPAEKPSTPPQKVVTQQKKEKTKPPAPKTKPLSLAASGDVEKTIESYIKELRKKGKLTSEEKTSWMVYDLTREKSVVDINANQIFQAASMIKPFVALAFFHRVKEGKLIYGPKSRRKMELMIQRSDNPATNWVMRMAGGPAKVDEILKTYYGSIFKNTLITEYIPAGGKTYKNKALPSDYIRFLQALWDDQLPYTKEIRRLMSLPGRDRLYDGTPIPQGTLVYNKTGSTAYLCGDMGILVPRDKKGKRYPYAIVGIIERSSRPQSYGRWMLSRGNVIRQVSTLVYQEMKKQYQLL